MQKLLYLFALSLIQLTAFGQEGFYVGGGFLFLNAAEEVVSRDGSYNLTISPSFTSSKATVPQAFPNVGFGGYVGYKHIFGSNIDKVRFWAGVEFSYNHQKMDIKANTDSLNFHTEVDYNFGPSIRLGLQYKKLSAYAGLFGFLSQRWNNTNSLVPNGVLYDLNDARTERGAEHPTYSKGVHTGVRTMSLGIEYFLKQNLSIKAEYTASKHVEYRNENSDGNYFDSGLGVYQTMFGITYYIWSPKK
ncbi:outer membrane protein [Aquimarina pacifica]|uniref:outer membrane protein n=1 Tax=Aquimarina pacifica TaxID=1296415 RepID=UPI00046EB894|nr:hypothetical protein [Aquimarina pacifica]